MLHLCHEDMQEDKRYELEMSWISEGTGFKHQTVPAELVAAAGKEALA